MKHKITIIAMILLLIVLTIVAHKYMKQDVETTTNELIVKAENIIENTSTLNTKIEVVTKEELELNDNLVGILKIPKLNVEAPVKEGTSQYILKYAVGHFSNSSNWNGNIALASHNRGDYVAHYFENINKLVVGDEIIYKTKFGERRYKVKECKKIKSTDWSVVSQTKDNQITLITCVKNEPEYRFCVKATEK